VSRSGPSDTHPEVLARIIAAHRGMTPREKMERVLACIAASETMARAGLRVRHPGIGEEELRRRLAALRLGPQLVRDAFGWDPDSRPDG
jgi:hypothetical protein